MLIIYVVLLGRIAFAAQAILPIATHLSIALSVCLSVSTFVHFIKTGRRI